MNVRMDNVFFVSPFAPQARFAIAEGRPARKASRHFQSVSTVRRRKHYREVSARVPPQNSGSDPGDLDDETETDDVISRRVFGAGVFATGALTLANGVHLFGGDEFKRQLALPFRRALPFLFAPELDGLGRPRAELDEAFASAFYDQHAVLAERLGILSRSELKRDETALLEKSRSLFFAGDDEVTDLELYNHKMYSRVHSIATHTSPSTRVKFSRDLGQSMLEKLRSSVRLPRPVETRRDPRSLDAIAEWSLGLQSVLDALVAKGWITDYSIGEFDSQMLVEEGRGELTVTCDDVYTLACAQLIGEEEFEEISPKVSGIILAVLDYYGLACSSEDYYLDRVYRPNAANYLPSQLVTQVNFTV